MNKKASSQASWSILAGGVSDARVEAYRLRIAVNQMVEALKGSPAEEEIHRLCGDNFLTIPDALSNLERNLDKTNYALITMGADFYRQRLPHTDRELVDLASKYSPVPSAPIYKDSDVLKVASQGNKIKGVLDGVLEKSRAKLTLSSQKDLAQKLAHFGIKVTSFEATRDLLSHIKIVSGGRFPANDLATLMEWAETENTDLFDDLEQWLFDYGSALQVLVGDVPYFDIEANLSRKIEATKRVLRRKGAKYSLLIWALTKFLAQPVAGVVILLLAGMTYPVIGLDLAEAAFPLFHKDEFGFKETYNRSKRLGG